NLSGKAVRYWLEQEKLSKESMLVITDDLSLPAGKIRIRAQGSAGGHNGLKNIEEILGTNEYPRLRFGIGSDFAKGQQVDYVLGRFPNSDIPDIEQGILKSIEAVKSFATRGLGLTMTDYNK